MYGFKKFPYTNFHELNIDWLLKKLKALEDWAAQFDTDELLEEIRQLILQMIEDGTFDEIFEEWVRPIREDITALQGRVTALETSQAAQDVIINGLQTTVASLVVTVNEHGDLIISLETRVEALETSQAEQDAELTEHDDRITALENSSSGQGGDISALATRVTNLENNYDTLNTTVTELSGTVTELGDTVTTYIAATDETLEDFEERIAALEVEDVPTWQTRNNIYKGYQAANLADLLSRIEAGNAYAGDFWHGQINLTAGSYVDANVFVARLKSNSGAYLLIVPDNIEYARMTGSDLSIEYIDSTIATRAEMLAQNNLVRFNNKLNSMYVGTSYGASLQPLGIIPSAANIVGYAARNLVDSIGLNAKFNFAEDYLQTPTALGLTDCSHDEVSTYGGTYATYVSNVSNGCGGYIKIETDPTLLRAFAVVVCYN